jgi:hypothetical protein
MPEQPAAPEKMSGAAFACAPLCRAAHKISRASIAQDQKYPMKITGNNRFSLYSVGPDNMIRGGCAGKAAL